MKRNPKLFLTDIFESIELIEKYTKGLTYNKFIANNEVQDAVARGLGGGLRERLRDVAGYFRRAARRHYKLIGLVVGEKHLHLFAHRAGGAAAGLRRADSGRVVRTAR